MIDKTITIDVADGIGFYPWTLDWNTGQWKKTYIQIIDYNEDGTLNNDSRETLRVRSRKGNTIYACKPEDDDEPNVFPGAYWRES